MNASFCSFFVIVITVFFIVIGMMFDSKLTTRIDTKTLEIPDGTCKVAGWNRVAFNNFTDFARMKKFSDEGAARFDNILFSESRLVSAFVYPDKIAVITSAMHTYGKPATCLYYDCNRQELPNSTFDSFVMPMAVVHCPRRYGAEFVSVSVSENATVPEPIPLTFRAFEKPVHEIAVCVGPLYGNESKWLEIVEFVEHYRLVGASYFYFTLFSIHSYDRRIIDDYSRLGLAEANTFQLEYEHPKWQFHMLQTNECHHRSRMHSKWVFNVDIDERFVYTGPGDLRFYLRSIPSTIGELSVSTNRVKKTETMPEKFSNGTLLQEMLFLKYNQTTEISWYNPKGIIRPELVSFLFYHWSFMQSEGVKVMSVPKRIAHLRHYRSTDPNALNGGWEKFYSGKYHESRLDEKFEIALVKAVENRVKYVYQQRMIDCEEITGTLFERHPRSIFDCRFSNETLYVYSMFIFASHILLRTATGSRSKKGHVQEAMANWFSADFRSDVLLFFGSV